MATKDPTTPWKLGLFVVIAGALVMLTAIYFGAAGLRQKHVSYASFFDEPVQGLDIGSPILFRGVRVGQVSDIDLAPDHRHVQVTIALYTQKLIGLGITDGKGGMKVPPELRVQLISQGITGLKVMQLDFFDVATSPAPKLPFPTPERTIATTPSTLKTIEASVTGAVERVPEIADAMVRVAANADHVLASIEQAAIGDRLSATLTQATSTMATVEKAVKDAQIGTLSKRASATLARVDALLTRSDSLMARLDGDTGVLASMRRASDKIGDAASDTPVVVDELTSTLRELREAAVSFQRLTDALERDPDMLLKGRGEGE